jgi:hypothetical protein
MWRLYKDVFFTFQQSVVYCNISQAAVGEGPHSGALQRKRIIEI